MAAIQMKNISKVYDKKTEVINGLNLEINDGEFMVLVGPSGCGKSTTLRMIAGLEDVSAGNITIADRDVTFVSPKDRDIAMVFQNYALYPHMDVFENMAFGLKLRKMPSVEIESRVNEAADILALKPLLDRKPKQLSGGQRQRVALGRAIVRHPLAFLFDEPLSNLDAKLRVQMRAEIKKLHQHLKTTMVYVTHDQVEAMTMGDRIVVMKDGVIHQVDTPENLYNMPADMFVAGFIGSPSMNFVTAQVTGSGGLSAENGALTIPGELTENRLAAREGMPVVIGIRPENMVLTKTQDFAPVKSVVELVEPMGSEKYVYVSIGDTKLVVKTSEPVNVAINDEVTLYVNTEKLHYFEMETGKSISIQK